MDADQEQTMLENYSSFTRRVEIIIGTILDLGFRVHLGTAAIVRLGRLASFGLNALNGGHTREQAAASMACCVEQEPGNGTRRRISPGGNLADNFTTVVVLPSWPRTVLADLVAVRVEQFGFRPLERPRQLAIGACLASVNLETNGMCL